MGMDEVKGRTKEAVGDLTDDDGLRREGKLDRAGGKAKDLAERAKDSAEDAVDKVKDKLQNLVD